MKKFKVNMEELIFYVEPVAVTECAVCAEVLYKLCQVYITCFTD
jgi:hypothetical protein